MNGHDDLGLPAGQEEVGAFVRGMLKAIRTGADPARGVQNAWAEWPGTTRCAVLAVGKAAMAMLAGAPSDGIERALIVARDEDLADHETPPHAVALGADHPLPSERNVRASARVEAWLRDLPERLPLVVMLSGGASAMLTSPAPGLTLDDLRDVTAALLRAGAPIEELNTVRKHLERLKGGRLGALVAGREVGVLVLSDVMGNHLDRIASGPLWPDPTTFADALRVLDARLPPRACETVRRHLALGARDGLAETPKPGTWAPPPHRLVGSNADAVDAACAEAARRGFRVVRVADAIEGEASKAAREFVRTFTSAAQAGPGPVALIGGGETTVNVASARGQGGRNQEFALAAAIALGDPARTLAMSVGTDGADGPTDAAGAVAWPGVLTHARTLGLDPEATLREHDSHGFFSRVGGAVPGAMMRGSNVNDVMVVARLR